MCVRARAFYGRSSWFGTLLGDDPLAGECIRFTCMVELAESAGELLLISNDPNEQPFIDRCYLEASRDWERLPEGVRIILDMMERESFNDIVDDGIAPVESDLATDDTLDQWLLENVWIGQHLSGTCKISPDSDPMAVVDQFGRASGISGLWVADASIMPDVIRANTNCTAIMIGERVADWIFNE